MRAAGIIFSNLNDNTLSRLTSTRTVAAIPFACRYNLVDFPLSCMVNSGITDVNVIANYNFRSLAEHLGSGKDWDLARRSGGIRLISPYQTSTSAHASMYSHHLEALRSMYEYIAECKEDTIVLSDCTDICNIDLKAVIARHLENDADVTFVTKPCEDDFTSKMPVMMLSSDGHDHVSGIAFSARFLASHPERFINLYVMKTNYLIRLLDDAFAYNYTSMSRDVFLNRPEEKKYYVYSYGGYVAPVSSFLDYYKHSIELTEKPEGMRELLLNRQRPVLTHVHNSAPTAYKGDAVVKSSLIADDCEIEGRVENSILFRGVKIGRGAVVRNCVLFAGTEVGANANLNCVVSDRNVKVTESCVLSGSKQLPFYIPRDRTV